MQDIIKKREQNTKREIYSMLAEIEQQYPHISEEQMGFVCARVTYLSQMQQLKFAHILKKRIWRQRTRTLRRILAFFKTKGLNKFITDFIIALLIQLVMSYLISAMIGI